MGNNTEYYLHNINSGGIGLETFGNQQGNYNPDNDHSDHSELINMTIDTQTSSESST